MSQNWYNQLPAGGSTGGRKTKDEQGNYINLPEGNYNQKSNRSLKIVKLTGSSSVGNGKTTRHNFLVGSDEEDGSAFLKIDLQDHWLRPEAIALAFRKKGADGKKQAIDAGILSQLDVTILQAVEKQITHDAEQAALAANTPPEALYDATEKGVTNTLLQIQINVGTIFRLCDWAGMDRNPMVDLGSFDDLEFEGSVKHRDFNGKTNAEVSVAHKKVNGAATPRKQKSTEFNPEEMQ